VSARHDAKAANFTAGKASAEASFLICVYLGEHLLLFDLSSIFTVLLTPTAFSLPVFI
jgi:hypothetical protein